MRFIIWPVVVIVIIVLYREQLVNEWKAFRLDRKQWLYLKWKDWGEPFVIAAILAILIRTFLVGPYKIPTGSMRPTFLEGDRIFVDKISYRFNEPERGDIVVFKYPVDKKKDFVKRLVAMPGETVEIQDGQILINGVPLKDEPFAKFYYYNREDWEFAKEGMKIVIPDDSYFVLGDNSAHSSDSRNWGFVDSDLVVGKAFVIWWPPKRVKHVA